MAAKENIRKYCGLMVCLAVLSVVCSCGKKTVYPMNQLDTPDHHVYAGLKLLDLGKYDDARRAFRMASKTDPDCSKAYSGMALVDIVAGNPDMALGNLDLGLKKAKSDEDKLFAHTAKIRYFISNRSDPHWLELSRKQYDEAVAINPRYAPVYYYMGLAYKEALNFDLAEQMFRSVLDQKTEHVSDAKQQLDFLLKLKSVKPESLLGAKIALRDRMTRADFAALLVEELKIKEICKRQANEPSPPETKIEAPKNISPGVLPEQERSQVVVLAQTSAKARDIADHPLRKEIEEILEIGINGLQVDSRGNFRPDEIISRGELAVSLEDIMTKVTGEKDLAAVYVSSKSLFPDVPSDMPYFKSIIAVASQDVMQAKDPATREFAPLKPVSGLEALSIVDKLKKKLKVNR